MRYAFLHKVPLELSDETMVKILCGLISRNKKQSLLKKSLRLMDGFVQIGFDGQDFIMARKTVKVSFHAYKVPRIIKSYLLK
jgi:hypothetical protein